MNFDVIVIGLGAMGSAATYQLAKRGAKVLGIDQFSPPHPLGSTHGETRVTRQAIGEGSEYVPLAMRTYEIFREIEAETGADLLNITGGLIIADANGTANLHGNAGFIEETIATAQKFGVKHSRLSIEESKRRFPQFQLLGGENIYYEDEMGFLRPENCVSTQLHLAEKYNGKIHRNEKVISINANHGGVEIKTDHGKYSADKVIVCAGAWVGNLIGEDYRKVFKVYRQVLYWFDVADNYSEFKPGKFPTFIWEFGRWENDFVYGFPAIDGEFGGLKIATETYESTTNPEEVNREISPNEAAEVYQKYLVKRIPQISPKLVKAAVCLYTVAPKSRFVIDELPENKRIIVASPCSGHGFKHSAAIGESLAQIAIDGKSKIDISAFSFSRTGS